MFRNWRRLGFLIPVVAFAVLVLTEYVIESMVNDNDFYQNHGWPASLGFLISAGLIYTIDRLLDREHKKANKAANGIVELRRDSFLYIPFSAWPLIFVVAAIGFLAIDLWNLVAGL